MPKFTRPCRSISLLIAFLWGLTRCVSADDINYVQVHWDQVSKVSVTVPTVLVVGSAPLVRGAPLHDASFKAIQALHCDLARYVPWQANPRLGVAELEPPSKTRTSWDFSLIDPMTEDFMKASEGRPIVLNFSTIPQWMFKTPEPVMVPADPNQWVWKYEQGVELRDPTFREVADYFARVVSWYVKGGFTDELGKRHESGHHYKIDYWEILNEPDIEHGFDVKQYTRLYDAVVEAVRKVSPETRFVGISLSYPAGHPEFFEYFLNPKNHKPGIPLDMISYHFYAVPGQDETPAINQYTFFNQADKFLEIIGYIESIRKRLSPKTGTMVNEIGSMLPEDWAQGNHDYVFKPIDPSYWNLSAAVFAYIYAGLARLGIDLAGESMIPALPGFFPSIAMLDWETGRPNVRWQVLKLIHDHLAPGDKLVETTVGTGSALAQGFITQRGEHKLLMINKRDRELRFSVARANGGGIEFVDRSTGSNGPDNASLEGQSFRLGPFGVAVVNLAK
ncbi:MAG: glycosyl hydrolase family 39 [Terriglobia bacterium]